MSEFKYFKGYPRKYFNWLLEALIKKLVILLILGILFIASFYINIAEGVDSLLMPAILGAFFLFIFLNLCRGLYASSIVKIVPYYKKEKDKNIIDVNTFSSGRYIAKKCKFLDELAIKSGLNPISKFGYYDDFFGEKVIWHNASDGLRTVSGLIEEIRTNTSDVKNIDRIVEELEKIEKSLIIATENKIPFCFILRLGGAWSGPEMDMREGYF